MRKTLKGIFICILFRIALPVSGQFDARFAQYGYLLNYYNPAAIGVEKKTIISAATRQQWIGMPGAPKTFFVSAQMPLLMFGKEHGLGISAWNEEIGLYANNFIHAQYAYKLKLWGGVLSLGLQAGIVDMSFDGSQIEQPESDAHEGTDPGLPNTSLQTMTFDAGFGLFYSWKNFYGGFSITHITAPILDFDENYSTYITRNYYFIIGGNIKLKNPLYQLNPSIFISTDGLTVTPEATLKLTYNNFLSGGLSYRYGQSVAVLLAGKYKDFQLGYAYEIPTTKLINATHGSHELVLSYQFNLKLGNEKNKNKYKSIRIL